jgi:hypothetical protein
MQPNGSKLNSSCYFPYAPPPFTPPSDRLLQKQINLVLQVLKMDSLLTSSQHQSLLH